MEDRILKLFSWLTPMFQDTSIGDIQLSALERSILDEFRSGWGKTDTESFLKDLSKRHGDLAGKTIEKVLAKKIKADWATIGEKEAHSGTEIADFIRVLWEPLKDQGFIFASETEGPNTKLHVTKCPVHELAESTGLHKWLYHLACASDFSTTCAFSSKIEFKRTKTLMEGDGYCDHGYYTKSL